jgi:hypothetical protein
MLLLILVLLLVFGFGGGYYGYNNYGPRGGIGIFGAVILIVIVLYFIGGLHGSSLRLP